jgi:Haem-binding domain
VADLRRRVALGAFAVVVVIQAFRPSRTNPPINATQEMAAVVHVDPTVQSILDHSCSDCHSNRTVWPWYSQVAPISWGVASDVSDGRRHMNFSEWGTYPGYKQQDLLDKACKLVTQHDMPPFTYNLIRAANRPTNSDRQAICAWTKANTEAK